jgi:hypothetical protein
MKRFRNPAAIDFAALHAPASFLAAVPAVTIAITTRRRTPALVLTDAARGDRRGAEQRGQDLCPAGSAVEPDVAASPVRTAEQRSSSELRRRRARPARPATTSHRPHQHDPVLAGRFMRILTGADVTIENVDIGTRHRLNQ